jgi:hypothetical protein
MYGERRRKTCLKKRVNETTESRNAMGVGFALWLKKKTSRSKAHSEVEWKGAGHTQLARH